MFNVCRGEELMGKMLNNYMSSWRLFIFSLAFLIIIGFAGQAIAADGDAATTELTTTTVSASTVAGLLESDLDGSQTTTINPNGGITLGARGGADAITTTSAGAAAITLTV
jgi:hypothetical protein